MKIPFSLTLSIFSIVILSLVLVISTPLAAEAVRERPNYDPSYYTFCHEGETIVVINYLVYLHRTVHGDVMAACPEANPDPGPPVGDPTGPPKEDPIIVSTIEKKKSSKCSGCWPPTIGMNYYNDRMVENGFVFNGIALNVTNNNTDYPEISTEIGVPNTMILKIYEERGISKLSHVHIELGAYKNPGNQVNKSEVDIELDLLKGEIKEINITDKQSLIQNVIATAQHAICGTTPPSHKPMKNCLEITVQYTYRESPKYDTVAITAVNDKNVSNRHIFSNIINVTGNSLNPSDTYDTHGKTYTQIDKWNDIWELDEIQYTCNSFNTMIKIT